MFIKTVSDMIASRNWCLIKSDIYACVVPVCLQWHCC